MKGIIILHMEHRETCRDLSYHVKDNATYQQLKPNVGLCSSSIREEKLEIFLSLSATTDIQLKCKHTA